MPPPTRNRTAKLQSINLDEYQDGINNNTTSNKRIRSASSPSLSSPETNQPSKMPATATADKTMLDTIVALFGNQKKEISSELNCNVTSIKSEIGSMVEKIRVEFHAELDSVREKVTSLSESVDQRFAQINEQLETQKISDERHDDDYMRATRSNELKIVGVHYKMNEQPYEIFCCIASLIGHNITLAPTVIRIFKRQGTEQLPLKLLIVKFVASHLRDEFYNCYLSFLFNKRIITGDLIGTGERNDRVTIGENLTPLNHKIFKECMGLKRGGQLFQVFTWNGLTKVKINKTSRAVAIKSQRELDLFVVNNQPNINSNGNQMEMQGDQTDLADKSNTVNYTNTQNK